MLSRAPLLRGATASSTTSASFMVANVAGPAAAEPIENEAEMLVEAPAVAVAAPIEGNDMARELPAEIIAIDEACAARDAPMLDTCAGNSMAAAEVPAPTGADIVQPAAQGAAPAAAAGTGRALHSACRYRVLVNGSSQELSADDDDGDSDGSPVDPADAGRKRPLALITTH
jgi:hypothetical protein